MEDPLPWNVLANEYVGIVLSYVTVMFFVAVIELLTVEVALIVTADALAPLKIVNNPVFVSIVA